MDRHAVAVLERSGLNGILGERCSETMVREIVGPNDQRERERALEVDCRQAVGRRDF